MDELVLIKLGGSVITDKRRAFCARESVIRRLGKEILEARKKGEEKLVIGHGSGSFGHVVAKKFETHKGLINKKNKKSVQGLVETSEAAGEINRIVVKNLIRVGLPVKSFAPASFLMAKEGRLEKGFFDPVKRALTIGVIPVIFGDVVMDMGMGFSIFSAEVSLNVLAQKLKREYRVTRMIHCTGTNGVYDAQGETIAKITPENFAGWKGEIGSAEGVDVTGGMSHKVEESLKMAKKWGIVTVIVNGARAGVLEEAIVGENLAKATVVGH